AHYVYIFYLVIIIISVFFFFFFFSSRRRHTRSYGDWSSDVCSSDLRAKSRPILVGRTSGFLIGDTDIHEAAHNAHAGVSSSGKRSEERRVGKECRSRWATDD